MTHKKIKYDSIVKSKVIKPSWTNHKYTDKKVYDLPVPRFRQIFN